MRFNMHCHQPKMYFRIDRSRQHTGQGGMGRGHVSSHFNQHIQHSQAEEGNGPNKRMKVDTDLNSGSQGRGNHRTLPAWLLRQQNQHDNQHSTYNTSFNRHNQQSSLNNTQHDQQQGAQHNNVSEGNNQHYGPQQPERITSNIY